jgi:outer membrane protein TolC
MDALVFTAYGEEASQRFRAGSYEVRTTTTEPPGPPLLPLDQAEAQAVEQRQDVVAARATLQSDEYQAAAAKRAVLPDLTATGSWGGTGNYQTGQPAAGWDAVSKALAFSDKQWSIGLSFSLPLLLRADRGKYESAKAAVENDRLLLITAENGARQDVRAADRAVRYSRKRLAEADQGVRLTRRQFEGEKKRLALKLSDPYRLLQVEHDSTQALLDQASAKADVARSETAYRLALGIIERDYEN